MMLMVSGSRSSSVIRRSYTLDLGDRPKLQASLYQWDGVARFTRGQSLMSVVVRIKRKQTSEALTKVPGLSFRAPLFMQGDGIRILGK